MLDVIFADFFPFLEGRVGGLLWHMRDLFHMSHMYLMGENTVMIRLNPMEQAEA